MILRNPEDHITIHGEKLVYDEAFKFVTVEGDPVLRKVDAQGRTTQAWSRVMKFFTDERRAELIDEVRIVRGEIQMEGAMAHYAVAEDLLILTGEPVVRQGDNELHAERIQIFVGQDRVLMEGRVHGKIYGEEES